jgi:hypothetical protein
LRSEGTLLQKQREWNANRDKRKKREYDREYSAMRRRKEGVTARGPWKKYQTQPRVMLNAEPLLRWIEEIDYSTLNEDEQHAIRRARDNGRIELGAVDRILHALGQEYMVPILYGDSSAS